jgi:predicted ATPase
MTRLSSEQGFPLFNAWATMYRGLVLAKQGQYEPGTTHVEQVIRGLQAAGCGLAVPYDLSLLAEAFACAGRIDEGLSALIEALRLIELTGERFHESEIRRMTGELLLMRPGPDEIQAEICFLQGIEIARSQDAKSFELRAAISLSRLWQRQGKRDEAHDRLAPIYNWFTEGFDTHDLKAARELLESLR